MINSKEKNISNTEPEYSLGLDLGISSIGWAVMVKYKNDHFLHDFGVRVFEVAEDPQGGDTNTKQRRQFRTQRRLIRRKANRIKRVKTFLQKIGFLTIKDLDEIAKNFQLKSTNKVLKEGDVFSVEKGFWNPFVLRHKGLKEKLTRSEIYAVLIHFCKKRGYLDKSLVQEEGKKEKANSTFDSALSSAEKIIDKFGYVSTAVLNDDRFRVQESSKNILLYVKNGKYESKQPKKSTPKDKGVNYRFLFSRENYEKELEAILKTQSKYYKEFESQENKKTLLDIVIKQRDFEVGPKCRDHGLRCQNTKCKEYKTGNCNDVAHKCSRAQCSKYKTFIDMVGRCAYYPQESRGFKSSLVFAVYQFVQEISKFMSVLKKAEIEFSKDDCLSMLKHFLEKGAQKKDLKVFLKNTKVWKEKGSDEYFKNAMWTQKKDQKTGMNLKEEKFLKTVKATPYFSKQIKEIIFSEDLIDALENETIHGLGKIINQNITRARRAGKIEEFLSARKISEKHIEEIAKNFSHLKNADVTNANVSFKHMKEVISIFLQGKSPMQVIHKQDQSFASNAYQKSLGGKKIFGKIIDPDLEKNPVVFRAINQSRKVLKALFAKYKHFANINIEMAREVAKSFKDRKKIERGQVQNEERNQKIKKRLSELGMDDNYTNLQVWKLWEEQKKMCLYCGEMILEEKMSPSKGHYQIDHIIPISQFADDSYENKALVCSNCNQGKGQKTPLEWLSTDPGKRKRFLARIGQIKNISWKKREYLMAKDVKNNADFQEFVNRNLNDTRYITKLFRGYVESQIKHFIEDKEKRPNILTIPGQITSKLRQKWLLGSAWGLDEKVRDITHFHHAVDAMIISQFKKTNEIQMVPDLIRLDNLKKRNRKEKERDSQENLYTKYQNMKKAIRMRWEKKAGKDFLDKVNLLESEGFVPFYIKDLKQEIEERIPVILKIIRCAKCKDWDRQKREVCKECSNSRKLPYFQSLLDEKEWSEKQTRNGNEKLINLKYPLVSYMTNYKIRGSWASSENFGFKDKRQNEYFRIWKQDPELLKEENRKKVELSLWNKYKPIFETGEGFVENKHGNIIPTDTYYGLMLSKDSEDEHCKWLRKIDLASKKQKTELSKKDVLVKGVSVIFSKDNEKKRIVRTFRAKTGPKFCIHANQLKFAKDFYENKKIFRDNSNYSMALSKIEKSKNVEIVRINILGDVTLLKVKSEKKE